MEYYAAQSAGEYMNHLNELCRLLHDEDVLERVGFVFDIREQGLETDEVEEEHPAIAAQNSLAQSFGSAVLAICNREVLSGLWHSSGCPGLFAALNKADCRETTMRTLQEYHGLLSDTLPSFAGTRFKEMIARSYLQDMFCTQATFLCVAFGRYVHERLCN